VARRVQRAPPLVPTASATLGPFYPSQLTLPGMNDLTRRRPGAPAAQGQLTLLSGRVLQEDRRGVPNLLVEIWQADRNGRFAHPGDRRNTPVDRNFAFWGRAVTDAEGRYAFRTIKPGPVPLPPKGGLGAPYIAVTLLGSGLMRRLVTRIYFPEEPRNAEDPLLCRIVDPAIRARLVARRDPGAEAPQEALGLAFDIVLRGADETPFLAD
jgi:protocatechuate 3,4-dioxygenase beta subunit